MSLKLKNPLAFFDLETTGTNVVEDRIVEISIVKLMPNNEKLTFTKRLNPGILIPQEATLVHGISNEDVINSPEFKLVAKEINKFLEGCDLAGFNIIQFDIPILVEEFLRIGINFKVENRKIIDSQKIFHLMEKRTLTAAYKFYCNKELVEAHSSMADTMATIEILESQISKYEGKPVVDLKGNKIVTLQNDIDTLHTLGTSNMIDFAKRMIYDINKIPVFNFGKHKGKSITKILKSEPSYYNWIMNSAFPEDTKRKLTQIKLEILKEA